MVLSLVGVRARTMAAVSIGRLRTAALTLVVSAAAFPASAEQPADLPCNTLCRAWLEYDRKEQQPLIDQTGSIQDPQLQKPKAASTEYGRALTKPGALPEHSPKRMAEPMPRNLQSTLSGRSSIGPAVTVPTLIAPRRDVSIGTSGEVHFVWSSKSHGKADRFFVEVRSIQGLASKEIFSGFVDKPAIRVALPKTSGAYAWRVAAVAPSAKRYVESAWQRFDVVQPQAATSTGEGTGSKL